MVVLSVGDTLDPAARSGLRCHRDNLGHQSQNPSDVRCYVQHATCTFDRCRAIKQTVQVQVSLQLQVPPITSDRVKSPIAQRFVTISRRAKFSPIQSPSRA